MAAAVMRNMSHGQNLHLLPNNCVIVSQTPAPVTMHHNHHHQNSLAFSASSLPYSQQINSSNQQMPQNQMQQLPQIHHHQHQHQTAMQTQQLSQMGKRPIAPAPIDHNRSSVISNIDQNRVTSSSSSSSISSSSTSSSKKNKLTYAHLAYGATQPASVQRRNARERNRVKQVNNGFANLRQHIPSDVVTQMSNGGRGASKKLSKVDTLRIAVEYIRRLQDMIDESDAESASTSSSSPRISQTSTGSYYSPSPMQYNSALPPNSETSASPTPSYTSDNSSVSNVHYTAPVPYKCEIFDANNPEDEELLDCIAWWQQQ